MKHAIILLVLLVFIGCNSDSSRSSRAQHMYTNIVDSDAQEDLIAIREYLKQGSPCYYANINGDTTASYPNCWTDTLKNYALVSDTSIGAVGVDRHGNVLFDVYIWGDCIFEEVNEGLFRVLRNGKVGFANVKGEIQIPCQFVCAGTFQNGQAKVAFKCDIEYVEPGRRIEVSEEWFKIDKHGNRVE
jgi:hypothetical protein